VGDAMLKKRNQTSDQEFMQALENIEQIVSQEELERAANLAIAEIKTRTCGQRTAIAWSGGKDSLVLYDLCQRAGISQHGVLGLTEELEYPEMNMWYAEHTPPDVAIIRRPFTYQWLAEHPRMLFPQDPRASDHWRRNVWQSAQNTFCEKNDCTMLILGRRLLDENYCGPGRAGLYRARGTWRYLPIRNWSHEMILAYLHYHQIELPPVYFWPNGFKEGTHPWPARLACLDAADGWAQTYACDPAIVERAADYFPDAAEYLAHPTPPKSLHMHVWSGRIIGGA
jgi:3'-phosphoadenosine 5'-phosphosulfate sulfotransferase (PAPS reductase)/FAD synthetase